MTKVARRLARWILLAVLTGGAVLAMTGPAWAHATLESTNPPAGAVIHGQLRTVSVTFDESVGVSADSLRVYAPDGSRADVGGAHHGTASSAVSVDLRPNLVDGTYTVAWQVISADSHPVSGAYTFSIGHPSAHLNASSVQSRVDRGVQVAYDAVRGLGFLSFMGFVGGVGFLLICWPQGTVDPTARRVIAACWAVLLITALASLLLQGPYGNDTGIGSLTDSALLSRTLHSRLGVCLLIRICLLVAAAVVLLSLSRSRPQATGRSLRAPSIVGFPVAAIGLAGTWSLAGHASVGDQIPLSVAADLIHLLAGAVWVGGLILLTSTTLRNADTTAAWNAVRVFSPLAGWCVLSIIATGTFQTWRNLGHWAAFIHTTYGLLLLAKVFGLLILIGLGYLARRRIGHRFLQRPPAPPASDAAAQTLRRLRVSVGCEVLVAVTVLGLTSVLVNTATGREAYTPPATATETFNTGTVSGTVRITVTPATVGPQTVRLVVSDSEHRPYRPAEIDVSLTLPAQHIGPLILKVTNDGNGSYHTAPAPVGIAGSWLVTATIRSDAFDETTVQAQVLIR